MLVLELDRRHRTELESHLATRAPLNVFQLDLLEHSARQARFFVAHDDQDRICATVLLVGEGRLAVPEGDPAGVAKVALEVCERFEIQRVIGPTTAADALYECMDVDAPRLDRVHRLMQITQSPAMPVSTSGSRQLDTARVEELDEIAKLSAAMHIEELGIDPREEDEEAFERNVLSRIKRGRTFVIRAGRDIVFKADVGSDCRYGAQVEGVYTRPGWRGRGFATDGLTQLTRMQLERRPRVTLHVFDGNAAALRSYEKVGFTDVAKLRLISAD